MYVNPRRKLISANNRSNVNQHCKLFETRMLVGSVLLLTIDIGWYFLKWIAVFRCQNNSSTSSGMYNSNIRSIMFFRSSESKFCFNPE